MSAYDFRCPRLYVEVPLEVGATFALERAQAHYLADVLRLRAGSTVLVFNGRDGEWRAEFQPASRRSVALTPTVQTRVQTPPTDLHYLFAPLKRSRLDYMVQKAVEMGVSRLQPVLTRHTQAERVNRERMHANAIEAAEQCGILTLPEIAEPVVLGAAIAGLDAARLLVFCDEEAPQADPLAALGAARAAAPGPVPLAVLVGPEGGFSAEERAALLRRSPLVRLSLGPRILRADTAAVASLALVQAALGDWGERGR